MRYTATTTDSFEAYADLANEALNRGFASPFQSAYWIRNWIDLVLDREIERPFFVRVDDQEGHPVMLMPMVSRRAYGLSMLKGMDGGLSDYIAPVLLRDDVDEAEGAAIRTAFYAGLPRADILHLQKMPPRIGERGIVNPLAGDPDSTPMEYSSHAIVLDGAWDTFLAAKVSTSSRATRRRKAKKLSQKGEVSFAVVEEPQARRSALAFTIEERSKRAKTRNWDINVLENGDAVRFCEQLVSDPLLVARVHVAVLSVSGEPIAVHLGLVEGGCLFWYMPTFRGEQWAAFSPGQMLLDQELMWAFDNGLKAVDLTIGDERYKQEWSPATSPLFELRKSLSVVGTAALGLRESARRIRQIVKKNRPHPAEEASAD
ncbi:GNAT family N-acetyltransferase [uncultured Alsobacter sp.]|uniref:GNAT family N-acetyltransferase n=1 Tax=uncultured Alsobacter sp. TaxID=1748258 RepID=UPI0025DECBB8|nr:GNAT family N-acetyltransferase [uncultured Alsobacter sp.]